MLGVKVLSALLLPPGIFLLLGLAALAVARRRRRAGAWLGLAAVVLAWAFSTPLAGKALLRSLEWYPPLDPHRLPVGAGAIVVLGGGAYPGAPEYGGAGGVSGALLERLRYGVFLARRSGLPILVTGGNVFAGPQAPEAREAARVLAEDYGIAPRWVEDRSRNTRENARRSRALLARAGIRRVLLVTHAWHMPRAARAFRRAGLDVVPAPTLFATSGNQDLTLLAWLPAASGLEATYTAAHEYLGILWYALTD